MRISDLQTKDIVNVKDGKKLGRIIDVEISDDGVINTFLIMGKKNMKLFSVGASKESEITFKQIIRIGEDVILIEL